MENINALDLYKKYSRRTDSDQDQDVTEGPLGGTGKMGNSANDALSIYNSYARQHSSIDQQQPQDVGTAQEEDPYEGLKTFAAGVARPVGSAISTVLGLPGTIQSLFEKIPLLAGRYLETGERAPREGESGREYMKRLSPDAIMGPEPVTGAQLEEAIVKPLIKKTIGEGYEVPEGKFEESIDNILGMAGVALLTGGLTGGLAGIGARGLGGAALGELGYAAAGEAGARATEAFGGSPFKQELARALSMAGTGLVRSVSKGKYKRLASSAYKEFNSELNNLAEQGLERGTIPHADFQVFKNALKRDNGAKYVSDKSILYAGIESLPKEIREEIKNLESVYKRHGKEPHIKELLSLNEKTSNALYGKKVIDSATRDSIRKMKGIIEGTLDSWARKQGNLDIANKFISAKNLHSTSKKMNSIIDFVSKHPKTSAISGLAGLSLGLPVKAIAGSAAGAKGIYDIMKNFHTIIQNPIAQKALIDMQRAAINRNIAATVRSANKLNKIASKYTRNGD